MTELKLAIVIGTTRQGRFGDKPAVWLQEQAQSRSDARYELVDLREYPLPIFDEAVQPATAPSQNETAKRWSSKIAEFDGYVFVTAEYNHGIPAVLKNAIDYCYPELARKPAAFLGYGGVGAARAIEQLRLVLLSLEMAPLPRAVHLGMAELAPMRSGEKTLDDFPRLPRFAKAMLDDLEWWARALREARRASG